MGDMTTISASDLRHLAVLSGLNLTAEEEASLGSDIEKIINYFGMLSELDTDGVEPTYQVGQLENVWREDDVEPSNISRDQLLALAPEQVEHQIKVPKVL